MEADKGTITTVSPLHKKYESLSTPGGSPSRAPSQSQAPAANFCIRNQRCLTIACAVFVILAIAIAVTIYAVYENFVTCKAVPGNKDATCVTMPDGRGRCWFTHVPASVAGLKSVPLVMVLHGYSGCAEWNNAYMHWDDIGDKNAFITIHPQGVQNEKAAVDKNAAWNAGTCCNGANEKAVNVDDVSFLRKAIETAILNNPTIDTSRVYISGHSNGCAMAQRMGLVASDLVAAVACHSFYLLVEPTANMTLRTLPFLEIHGRADMTVPYDVVPNGPPYQSIGAVNNMHKWGSLNGCYGNATVSDMGTYSNMTYGNCKNGAKVTLITIPAPVRHFPFYNIGEFDVYTNGQPRCSVDTTSIAWSFLKQYTRKL